MYCNKCGKPLREEDRFCSSCGARVEKEFVPAFKQAAEEEVSEQKAAHSKSHRNFHIENFNWDLDGYPTDSKRTEDIDFNWDSVLEEKQKNIFAREWEQRETAEKTAAVSAEFPETAAPDEDAVSLEETLFKEMGSPDTERATKVAGKSDHDHIDRFYTFNKKNEEFQALLDQEYERIKNGRRDEPDGGDDEFFEKSRSAAGRHEEFDWTLPEGPISEKLKDIEEAARQVQAAQMPKPEYVGVILAAAPKGYMAPETKSVSTDTKTFRIGKKRMEEEPAKPAEVKEPQPAAETADAAQSPPSTAGEENAKTESAAEAKPQKLTFDDVFGNDDDIADEKPKKKGKVLKAIAVILCILVALELVMIGIQYFAPDSAAAKTINKGYESVLSLFASEEEEAPEAEPEPEASEIAGIIEEKKAASKNIVNIVEDAALVFEDGKTYGFEDFANAYTFADKPWYEDENGESVTYGGEIIDTVIRYYSAWLDKINGKNEKVLDFIDSTSDFYMEIEELEGEKGVEYGINKLSIGEIRAGGAGFYVLISAAAVNSDTSKETAEKQIVYLEPVNKSMKIVDIKDI